MFYMNGGCRGGASQHPSEFTGSGWLTRFSRQNIDKNKYLDPRITLSDIKPNAHLQEYQSMFKAAFLTMVCLLFGRISKTYSLASRKLRKLLFFDLLHQHLCYDFLGACMCSLSCPPPIRTIRFFRFFRFSLSELPSA